MPVRAARTGFFVGEWSAGFASAIRDGVPEVYRSFGSQGRRPPSTILGDWEQSPNTAWVTVDLEMVQANPRRSAAPAMMHSFQGGSTTMMS